jgi:hypothetical protein
VRIISIGRYVPSDSFHRSTLHFKSSVQKLLRRLFSEFDMPESAARAEAGHQPSCDRAKSMTATIRQKLKDVKRKHRRGG